MEDILSDQDKYYELLQDLEEIYTIGVQYGDYWDMTLQEFISKEMAKRNQRRSYYTKALGQETKADERNRKITQLLNARLEYIEKQQKQFQEAQQARMLQELEEYGLQQNANWFRRERNRRAAILKLQLKKQANSAYNAPNK